MAVPTLTAIPCEIVAGDTTIVSLSEGDYPATLWTLDLVLSRNGSAVKAFRSEADGTAHVVTFSGALTAAIAPGPCQVFRCYTEIATNQRVTVAGAPITMRPNPTTAMVETEKQASLRLATAELNRLASTPGMVGFNQTQVVGRDIEKQKKIVDRLQSEVWAEMRAMGLDAPGGARTIVSVFR